ncbi:copper chaperone PCu(A)C [Sphingomicrobium lutaoense]|uniref:Copper chaperone PCu(A)C n=1 Tax=Sphingomicrobium lutaoense TaxID=515949 RepID=A0A839Z0S1_9SPHN|nr:copper chaperone PCu(A)C [Sphingomicrobium lutaoense]MBB3763263.1 hypothetical protein [Sphingomicrobium lutaoense]
MFRLASLYGACFALAACSTGGVVDCEAARPVASEGWARESLTAQAMGAAYFRLSNQGDCPAVLTGASSPLAASVGLHESREENGVARMRPVERVEIAPGRNIDFAPGGLHLMLSGLERSLAAGEQLPVMLSFEDGPDLELTISIEEAGAR